MEESTSALARELGIEVVGIDDAAAIDVVVATGLFAGMAYLVLVQEGDAVRVLERQGPG